MRDDPALTEFVVAELARGEDRGDVILQVCERAGCKWPEAEDFVRHIESTDASRITRRQTPALLLIIVPTLIGGVALTLGAGYVLLQDLLLYDRELGGQLAIGLLAVASQHAQTLYGILIGLAMIVGSGVGLGQIIAAHSSP
jgi:hypothetical protein